MLLCKPKKAASDPLPLIFGEDEKLCNGAEKTAVRKEPETANQRTAVLCGDIDRLF